MSTSVRLSSVIALAALASTSMAVDLSTPQAALQSLELAYARMDIEGAVAAKDFNFEARELLVNLRKIGTPDQAMIEETAKVLELSFRKHIRNSGFPVFGNLRCSVIHEQTLREGLVQMVEECVFPDGGKSRDTVHAAKSAEGWRIVIFPQ